MQYQVVQRMSKAFLFVNPEKNADLYKIAKQYPEIKEISKTLGDYTFVCRVESNNIENMKDTIRDIRHSLDIKSTMCLITTTQESPLTSKLIIELPE